jgi:hypothetical protein
MTGLAGGRADTALGPAVCWRPVEHHVEAGGGARGPTWRTSAATGAGRLRLGRNPLDAPLPNRSILTDLGSASWTIVGVAGRGTLALLR